MELNLATQKAIKRSLGKQSADLVEEGMLVGLGSGSTASCFIESLIVRCREGLKITAVASSKHSMELAQAGGIHVLDMDLVTQIDLTVDGADEVDKKNRLIKGGGGAHTREKILASTSRKVIIIVDESKMVDVLGRCGVPIEILPFGFNATIDKVQKLGMHGTLRKNHNGSFYITDNGNYLFDIQQPKLFPHPENIHEALINIPGVVETGFFFNLPIELLVGYSKDLGD